MKVFTVMPFRPRYDEIYRDVIEFNCAQLFLTAERADQILAPGPIPPQIFQSIRESLFLVADVSDSNENVFYELGYAHALEKKIIVLANDQKRNGLLPFDIRVIRTIFYDETLPDWKGTLIKELGESMRSLVDFSRSFEIDKLRSDDKVSGHRHKVSGRYTRLEFSKHLWCFARRIDLDHCWGPQNDGEIEVNPDGSWSATLYLGWEANKEDLRVYEIRFGTINTRDNRAITEQLIRARVGGDYSAFHELPHSFHEVASLNVERVGW